MGEFTVTINLPLEDEKQFRLFYQHVINAEDVCIAVCKHLKIGPVARHLFALRVTGTSLFLDPSAELKCENCNLDFRLRFKPFQVSRLRMVDPKAYQFYFQQVRLDIIESKVSDQIYEKHKSEVLGLTVTDMFRVMLEKNISREVIERDYKKFVPQKVLKMHRFFVKQPIHKSLEQLEIQTSMQKKSVSAEYLITQYLTELETLAPEYLIETYKVLTMIEDNLAIVIVKVLPPHFEDSGVQFCLESKLQLKEWSSFCSIQDLGHISVSTNGEIEISRLNGNPLSLKFDSIDSMWSFVSLVDGYYRLACKWTFNLCQTTPKLKKLNDMMCHGPVGGEFSYAKLERETNNKLGCFILRESERSYTTYYIDVCLKEGLKPSTFKLEQVKGDSFLFEDDLKLYKSVQEALQSYNSPESSIYLRECVPPSEYDVSPLLLCRRDDVRKGLILADVADVPQLAAIDLRFSINQKDLQVFIGHRKEGFRKLTVVYKGMRKLAPGKKIEVALKFLQENQKHHLKDFLNLIGQWRFLRSSTVTRFYGMVISSKDVFVVMEYFKLGPLDQYLRDKRNIIKVVDLIEAAASLASALWYLKENDIVHGMIRCRKVMVHSHDDNGFIVKLSDKGIFTGYDQSDVHWIPVECYNNLDKMSTAGDVWAWATTVYEIFTYGEPFPHSEYNQTVTQYLNGNRLSQPQSCPDPLYKVMLECWHDDARYRKQAQALSRDVNQFMHHVWTFRKKSDLDAETWQQVLDEFNTTVRTCEMRQTPDSMQDLSQYNFFASALSASSSLRQIVNVFELDPVQVILKDRVGQGFYGDVFKGIVDGNEDCVTVAVKKLNVFEGNFRELNAMKNLKHPNIVRILAVLRQPHVQLVMEYAPHGSLQSYLRINRDNLGPKKLLKYATDVANGMEYLSNRNIVHQELATRNVLVMDDDHVKVSDFGLARLITADLINSHNRNLPMKWFAPEILANDRFTTKSDVWAYGVTLWEIFSYGQDPPMLGHSHHMPEGQDQMVFIEALRQGVRYSLPNWCPQIVYASLMRPCWEENPDGRPTFTQLALEARNLTERF